VKRTALWFLRNTPGTLSRARTVVEAGGHGAEGDRPPPHTHPAATGSGRL